MVNKAGSVNGPPSSFGSIYSRAEWASLLTGPVYLRSSVDWLACSLLTVTTTGICFGVAIVLWSLTQLLWKYCSESFRHLLWRWSASKANSIMCYLSKLNYMASEKQHTNYTGMLLSLGQYPQCSVFLLKSRYYSHHIMLRNKKESGLYKIIDWK